MVTIVHTHLVNRPVWRILYNLTSRGIKVRIDDEIGNIQSVVLFCCVEASLSQYEGKPLSGHFSKPTLNVFVGVVIAILCVDSVEQILQLCVAAYDRSGTKDFLEVSTCVSQLFNEFDTLVGIFDGCSQLVNSFNGIFLRCGLNLIKYLVTLLCGIVQSSEGSLCIVMNSVLIVLLDGNYFIEQTLNGLFVCAGIVTLIDNLEVVEEYPVARRTPCFATFKIANTYDNIATLGNVEVEEVLVEPFSEVDIGTYHTVRYETSSVSTVIVCVSTTCNCAAVELYGALFAPEALELDNLFGAIGQDGIELSIDACATVVTLEGLATQGEQAGRHVLDGLANVELSTVNLSVSALKSLFNLFFVLCDIVGQWVTASGQSTPCRRNKFFGFAPT